MPSTPIHGGIFTSGAGYRSLHTWLGDTEPCVPNSKVSLIWELNTGKCNVCWRSGVHGVVVLKNAIGFCDQIGWCIYLDGMNNMLWKLQARRQHHVNQCFRKTQKTKLHIKTNKLTNKGVLWPSLGTAPPPQVVLEPPKFFNLPCRWIIISVCFSEMCIK